MAAQVPTLESLGGAALAAPGVDRSVPVRNGTAAEIIDSLMTVSALGAAYAPAIACDTLTIAAFGLEIAGATTISAFGATLVDDDTAATARGTLEFTAPILDKASPGDIGGTTAAALAATTGTFSDLVYANAGIRITEGTLRIKTNTIQESAVFSDHLQFSTSTIARTVDNSFIRLSGGSAFNTGSRIEVFGTSHAAAPDMTNYVATNGHNFTGVVNIDDTTDAASTTTGALIVDGGVGIAKKLYVGGTLAAQAVTATTVNTSTSCGVTDQVRQHYDSTTGERGMQLKLVNKTGASSVKGTIVEASTTTASAFSVVGAGGVDTIAIVYEAGIADGSSAWCWMPGSLCQVLLQDSTAATRGYWVKVSDTVAGRADATNAAPPGGTIAALEDHFSEVGQSAESKTAGTNVLCLLHFHVN